MCGSSRFGLRDSLSNPKFALVGASVTQLLPSSMGFFDDLVGVVDRRYPFLFSASRGNDGTIHGKTRGGQKSHVFKNKTIDVTPLLIHHIK